MTEEEKPRISPLEFQMAMAVARNNLLPNTFFVIEQYCKERYEAGVLAERERILKALKEESPIKNEKGEGVLPGSVEKIINEEQQP